MHRLIIATVLSFVIPGAGLCYIGRWSWGVTNLLLVTAIVGGIAIVDPVLFDDMVHYLVLGCAAASAGFTHSVAARQNGSPQAG